MAPAPAAAPPPDRRYCPRRRPPRLELAATARDGGPRRQQLVHRLAIVKRLADQSPPDVALRWRQRLPAGEISGDEQPVRLRAPRREALRVLERRPPSPRLLVQACVTTPPRRAQAPPTV